MFSNNGGVPSSIWDILLMPLLLTFFGIAARVGAAMYQRNYGTRAKRTWISYIPLVLALFYGAGWLYQLYNFDETARYFYLNSGLTQKLRLSHYFAFLIPLVALGTSLFLDWRSSPCGGVRATR